MTDVAEAPTPAAEEQARRGRPRPTQTIERDKQVLDKIADDGSTRDELVQAFASTETPLSPAGVYLSLYRLRSTGLIERVRDGAAHRWKRTDGQAAPTPATPEPAIVPTSAV